MITRDWVIIIHPAGVPYFIPCWQYHRLNIRKLGNRSLKIRYLSFREKPQQRLIIYCFSLKGWNAHKIPKERGKDIWCRCILPDSDLMLVHSLQHKRHFLPRRIAKWQTALNLAGTPWAFLGKVSIRSCPYHNNVVQHVAYHSQRYLSRKIGLQKFSQKRGQYHLSSGTAPYRIAVNVRTTVRGCDIQSNTWIFDQESYHHGFASSSIITLNVLLKRQNCTQDRFVHNIAPSLHVEKRLLSDAKTPIDFSIHLDHSICCNRLRTVDELHRLNSKNSSSTLFVRYWPLRLLVILKES
jgi:hypothetical protein